MKRIKKLNGWGIYQNNDKELLEYGFAITVIHPDNMDYASLCTPADSDMEFDNVELAELWINNYEE